MTAKTRLLMVAALVIGIALGVSLIAIAILYDTAFETQRERLREIAQSRARTIEVLGHHDAEFCQKQDCQEGAFARTIQQIREAHDQFEGFGQTGEFTLARVEGDEIAFLVSHRHKATNTPSRISINSVLAEPMRRALKGESGTMVGKDYRAAKVLAAYEPVGIYDLGIVAKIDLEEFAEPFKRAGLICLAMALVLGFLGATIVRRHGNPLLESLKNSMAKLEVEIAQHRVSQAAREESEAKLKQVLDSSPIAIMVSNDSGAIEYVNEYFTRIFGYASGDITTISQWWLLACPIDEGRAELVKKISQLLLTSEKFDESKGGLEWELLAKNGNPRLVALYANSVGGRNLILLSDITKQKALEQQLNQSQKLESIGRLSGGVAHDFNNLLTVILGAAAFVDDEIADDSPQKSDIREVIAAARRAAELTRQLLAFSRKQILQPVVLDVGEVVKGLDSMLRRLLGEDIDIQMRKEDGLGLVKADPHQIEQVIINLAVNARDAMPKGGKLTIETANVSLDEEYAQSHTSVVPGRYVMIAMSDTGEGMSQETQARIFEPFFTTKEIGKGTGLGLSMVYGTIKQSGGNIWVYSELGQGTTLKIYLPITNETIVTDDANSVAYEEIATSRETILLVEDEGAVRDLAARLLQKEGYRVLCANCGKDALAIASTFDGTIHLLLTDVVMPQMSGRELVVELMKVRPTAKTLFMSGYTDNAIVHRGTLDAGTNFLEKPFGRDQLLRKVAEVLEQ